MWTQPADPFGILWLSAIVAALPIMLFLICLVVFKLTGVVAAIIAVIVEIIIALWAFGMPASAAAGAGLYGLLNALWPITYIIVMAVWLYRLAVASGHFDVVQESISSISADQRIQVLLIAFAFGAFLEGAAGFGVPIAICAALLVQLGFRPVKAAMICLVANVAAGAYGAIGVPVIVGANVGGVNVMDLSRVCVLLLQPLIDGKADACFGSRFLGGPHRVLYYWHSVGNTLLTLFSNMLTNLNLTDMETCYKAVRGELARSLNLTSDRFGFEPEITARLAQRDARIYEVPISYAGRTYAEGKKINWKDGVAAFWHILKFSLSR